MNEQTARQIVKTLGSKVRGNQANPQEIENFNQADNFLNTLCSNIQQNQKVNSVFDLPIAKVMWELDGQSVEK